jgi:hemoglobin
MNATTMYADLGGDAGVKAVVGVFYERVLADAELAPYFAGVELARLKAHQRAFLSAVTGGPELFTGRPLEAAHAGLDITAEHFDRVVDHLASALGDLGVAAPVVATIRDHVEGLRDRVVASASS